MSPRDTSTGAVLEEMIRPALDRGGYGHSRRKQVRERPGGRPHWVDTIAEKDGHRFLVSLKWQQSDGTAEHKIPFELMCLADAVREGPYDTAYLVLGGTDRGPGRQGWTMRSFYINGGLSTYIFQTHIELVQVISLEDFVARANRGQL